MIFPLAVMAMLTACGARPADDTGHQAATQAAAADGTAGVAEARRVACVDTLRGASPGRWPLERSWYPVTEANWYANGPDRTDTAADRWIGTWTQASTALGQALRSGEGGGAEAAFLRLLALRRAGEPRRPAQAILADTDLLGAAVALRQQTGKSTAIVQAVAASNLATATARALKIDRTAAVEDASMLLSLAGTAPALAIDALRAGDREAAERAYAIWHDGRTAFTDGAAIRLFGGGDRAAMGCSADFLERLERFVFEVDAHLLTGAGDAATLRAEAARLEARAVGDAAAAAPMLATYRGFLKHTRPGHGDAPLIALLAAAHGRGGIHRSIMRRN